MKTTTRIFLTILAALVGNILFPYLNPNPTTFVQYLPGLIPVAWSALIYFKFSKKSWPELFGTLGLSAIFFIAWAFFKIV
ncbi:hypothetical protein [Leptolyngbya phage Lbo-JY46]